MKQADVVISGQYLIRIGQGALVRVQVIGVRDVIGYSRGTRFVVARVNSEPVAHLGAAFPKARTAAALREL